MRRKRIRDEGLATAGLLVEAAPAPPSGYERMPYSKQREVFEQWHEAFSAWRSERSEWADAHGWPGGTNARLEEESAVLAACPDSPFDPEWEIANGYL